MNSVCHYLIHVFWAKLLYEVYCPSKGFPAVPYRVLLSMYAAAECMSEPLTDNRSVRRT